MKSISRRTFHSRGISRKRKVSNCSHYSLHYFSAVILATLLSSTAFAWRGGTATATKPPATASKPANMLTEAERKATGRIKLEYIREITTKLSSKEFEGRGTGQPGADKAAVYLADLFKKFGLKPADNGTYPQQIKFRKRPNFARNIGQSCRCPNLRTAKIMSCCSLTPLRQSICLEG